MNEQPTSESTGHDPETDVFTTRSLSYSLPAVWNALMTAKGNAALLGEGAQLGDKGDEWRAEDGTHGVIRTYHPMEEIRFSFHEAEDAPSSLVALHVTGEGDSTNIELTQSRLPADADRTALRERWEKVLDRIDGVVGGHVAEPAQA